ncbi:MAG: hypothetical protein KAQ98_08350 [Bacteriovoracaceae bacterium]|nr:hypothetical protein [Bacteriovoracaceae bacterium]
MKKSIILLIIVTIANISFAGEKDIPTDVILLRGNIEGISKLVIKAHYEAQNSFFICKKTRNITIDASIINGQYEISFPIARKAILVADYCQHRLIYTSIMGNKNFTEEDFENMPEWNKTPELIQKYKENGYNIAIMDVYQKGMKSIFEIDEWFEARQQNDLGEITSIDIDYTFFAAKRIVSINGSEKLVNPDILATKFVTDIEDGTNEFDIDLSVDARYSM